MCKYCYKPILKFIFQSGNYRYKIMIYHTIGDLKHFYCSIPAVQVKQMWPVIFFFFFSSKLVCTIFFCIVAGFWGRNTSDASSWQTWFLCLLGRSKPWDGLIGYRYHQGHKDWKIRQNTEGNFLCENTTNIFFNYVHSLFPFSHYLFRLSVFNCCLNISRLITE